VAAEELGRRWIGIDHSPRAMEVAKKKTCCYKNRLRIYVVSPRKGNGMNPWIEKSIELANTENYLDRLHQVYPV
jgi:hypothetical protein